MVGVLWCNMSQAQPDALLFRQYTTNDGLPHNFVNDVQRDYRGFIWVATVKGVSRFDGFQFTNYLDEVHDAPHWGVFGFHDLVMDKMGRIWTTNHEKLFWFDEKRDCFREFKLPANMQQLLVLMDFPGADAVWFYQGGNIYTLDAASFRLDSVTKAKYLPLHNVQIDPAQQQIWFGGHHRADTIQIYDIRKRTWTYLPFHREGSNKSTWGFSEDEKGQIWVGSEKLSCRDPANGRWKHWLLKNEQGKALFDYKLIPSLCSDTILWMSNQNYLRCFDTRSRTFTRKYFGDAMIGNVISEQTGEIWLCTPNGLFHHTPRQPMFQWSPFFFQKNETSEKPAGEITAPLPHRANKDWAWLVCYGKGVALCDLKKQKIIRRCLDINAGTPLELTWNYMIFALRSERLWLINAHGIMALNEHDGTHQIVTNAPKFHWIGNAATDPAGNLWFEQHGQFYISDSTKNRFHPVDLPFVSQLKAGVRDLCFDRHGNLWVMTNNELLSYKPSSQQFRLVPIDWSLVAAKGKRHAADLEVDSAGNAWIATWAGLYRCNLDKKQFKLYDYRQGFSSGYAETMAIDVEQNIWVTSRFGLFRFDRHLEQFVKIRLPSIETEATQSIESFGPLMWLTMEGARGLAFDPSQFVPQPPSNPVIIALRLRGQAYAFDPDSVRQFPVKLDYLQNVLTFDFSAIDFEQGDALTFEYQLEPFDRDWVSAGQKRSVTYTSLDGGAYTFRVRTVNNWGLRSEREAVFKLYVRPPFYRTWWFFALCTLALGGIFYAVFRYRELQRLEKEKIRQRIARDLHDDVGSTLSSISILSDAALSGAEQELEKQRFGNIGEKARSALDSISDIVWAVNPQNDAMEKVIEHMIGFAVEMLEPAGISVDVFIDKKVNALKLPMEQRKEFYLLFKEAVNNCVKHSKAKNAHISLTCQEGKLQLKISDDGVGFNLEKQSPGNGLQNMRARAKSLEGDLEVGSTPGQGTVVILSLLFVP